MAKSVKHQTKKCICKCTQRAIKLVEETHLSPPSESRVNLEVEDAERDEGYDAGDDELGQVVVEEYVVDVHSQVGREDAQHGSVQNVRRVRLLVEPEKSLK